MNKQHRKDYGNAQNTLPKSPASIPDPTNTGVAPKIPALKHLPHPFDKGKGSKNKL